MISMARKKKERLTVKQRIYQEVYEIHKHREHDLTRKQYIAHTKRFVDFCKENHKISSFEDCRPYIQEYADYLKDKDLSPSSVHTYMAAVVNSFGCNLDTVQKPKRKIAAFTRGRKTKLNQPAKNDLNDKRWEHIVFFEKAVGIRRSEIKKLTASDFVYDESGYPCIQVKCGKGGKYQLNRILPKYVDDLQWYFCRVDPTERIFDKKDFQNNLNFHKLRADSAKEYYFYQLDRIQNEPGYAKQLEEEIIKRWNLYNLDKKTGKPKYFDRKQIEGYYYVRGDLRKLALEKGSPIKYDRLAVMATSIFKLSHFRLNVAVENYLLA